MLWVLNLSDGADSLLDIAERWELELGLVTEAIDALVRAGLLVRQ
jgi:aminopeptidase-like protein